MFPQLLQELRESTLSAALAVLTSMITPALLLSATGTFILSTSNRLGRCMDRVRTLSEWMEKLVEGEEVESLRQERHVMMLAQVELQTKRALLLQKCLSMLEPRQRRRASSGRPGRMRRQMGSPTPRPGQQPTGHLSRDSHRSPYPPASCRARLQCRCSRSSQRGYRPARNGSTSQSSMGFGAC